MALFKELFYRKSATEQFIDIPLYDCAAYINGTSFAQDEYAETGLPIVKIAELKNGITPDTQYFIGTKAPKYLIDDKDILFSWSGNPDTSIDTFIWYRGKAILNQHTFKIDWSNNGYAYTFFLLKFFKPEFAKEAKNKQTTGLGHVTIKDLQRLTVPYNVEVAKDFNRWASPFVDGLYRNLVEIKQLSVFAEQLTRQMSVLK